MNKKDKIAFLWMIASLITVHIETAYFGWNMLPHSINEAICDMIAIGLMTVGIIILIRNNNG